MPIRSPVLALACLASSVTAGTLPLSAQAQGTDTAGAEFVVYETEPGWLRVGSRAEYDAVWKKSDEIAGGKSDAPLAKTLLTRGYESRAEALEALAAKLTDVQLRYPPPTSGLPIPHLTAEYEGREYKLRLTPGFDEETASLMARTLKFYRALEYDWESEWAVLARYGITPLQVFGARWLVHVVERSDRLKGSVTEDRWMAIPRRPFQEAGGALYHVRLGDGIGGTIGYTLDIVEGPFRSNYAMAPAMERLGLSLVDLWPPVQSVARLDAQPRVDASLVPEDPRNWGEAVLPVQPVDPVPALEDWVVYVADGRWLTVATRQEFLTPWSKNDVIWGGNSDELIEKTLLLPAEGEEFTSRRQALRAAIPELTQISYVYHPNASPRVTVQASYRGRTYELRLDRGPSPDRQIEHRSLAYDAGDVVEALREVDPNITPRHRFGEQWLVFADGHHTSYGYNEVNRWMMIGFEPDNGQTFRLPDGIGGMFTYDYSGKLGPFTDSYALIEALRGLENDGEPIRAISLAGSSHMVYVDEIPPGITPTDRGTPVKAPDVRLVSMTPESAFQGEKLGIILRGHGIDNAPVIDLGEGITIQRPVWFTKDENNDADYWVATASIAQTAPPGVRELALHNADGGTGRLQDAFEVKEREPDLCPAVELVIPAGAAAWIQAQTEPAGVPREQADQADVARVDVAAQMKRFRLFDALQRVEDLRAQEPAAREEVLAALKELLETRRRKAIPPYDEKRAEAFEKALKRWDDAVWQQRANERGYLREASALAPAFTPVEDFRLVHSARRRLACLGTRLGADLDLVRENNYTTTWDAYHDVRRLYDIRRKQFENLAGSLQNTNATRLAAAQARLGVTRDSLAEEGRLRGPAAERALRPLQRRVRDVYLDMGEVALARNLAGGEAALLAQDSYLAGVWAVHKETESIERAETLAGQAAQQTIFGLKYALGAGSSLIPAGADLFKRVVNYGYNSATGLDVFSGTVSAEITKKVEQGRKDHELALKGVERLRRLTDEQTADLTQRYTGDAALALLAKDRLFHEATTGGVGRLVAVYLVEPEEVMEAELSIAVEHAELALRDMKKAYNARVLAEPNGEFKRFRRILMNPVGAIRVMIQDTDWGGDHFTATADLIAEREAQLREIEGVREALRRVGFDPVALQRDLPTSYATYLELEDGHPEFLQWTMTRDQLESRQRSDRLLQALGRTDSPGLRARYERQLALNGGWLRMRTAGKQPRLYQLQGFDKLMLWDYAGALESLYLAAESDPRGEVQPLAPVEALREDLNWQATVDAGLDTFVSIGNMGYHAAAFELAGMALARSFPLVPIQHARLFHKLSFDDFAHFAWGKINPLNDLIKAGVVHQEKVAVTQALRGATGALAENAALEVVQKDLIAKGLAEGYMGVDAQWADFLASAIMGVAQSQQATGRTLFGEVATNLGIIGRNFRFRVIDWNLHIERNASRHAVSDLYTFLRWADEFETAKRRVRTGDVAGDAATRTAAMADAEARVRATLEPLTRDALQERYEAYFAGDDAPAPGSPERIARIRTFLRGLPWKDGVMELGLGRNDPLNRRVDNLRRELLAVAQVRFLERHPDYGDDIVSILFIGSAGNRNNDAYKLTDSDIDFTILVRDDLPESRRAQLRDDFMRFFQEMAGGRDMEGLDMAVMVDPLPKFDPTGESVEGFLAGAADPARRNALRRNIEATTEQLVRNASDDERYLDRGNLFRHNLFVRLGGKLKEPRLVTDEDGAELADAPDRLYDDLYGDVPLEPWMAFDAVVGNMGYVQKHRLEKPNDIVHYQKQLAGKYGIRGPLFAMVLSSPAARARLRGLTRAEVEAAGWDGPERILVEVTKEILGRPDGLKELGLPATIQVPGEATPRAMNGRAWRDLMDQWIMRKEGKELSEILDIGPDGMSHGERLQHNLAASETFWKASVRKSILDQATAIQQFRNAAADARAAARIAREAGDEALSAAHADRAAVIDLKIKELFLSQLAVWSRMSRDQQLLVMKELPPEADYWVAIDAVERFRQRSAPPTAEAGAPPAKPRAAMVRDWSPAAEDDENLQTRIERLLEEAAAAEEIPLFHSNAAVRET